MPLLQIVKAAPSSLGNLSYIILYTIFIYIDHITTDIRKTCPYPRTPEYWLCSRNLGTCITSMKRIHQALPRQAIPFDLGENCSLFGYSVLDWSTRDDKLERKARVCNMKSVILPTSRATSCFLLRARSLQRYVISLRFLCHYPALADTTRAH
jgi:hypothetical protein